MNSEERKAIALERKRKLASRLDSNELLLLSLRFYLGILEPGRPVAASLAYDRSKGPYPPGQNAFAGRTENSGCHFH
jgi:hypothetical protein